MSHGAVADNGLGLVGGPSRQGYVRLFLWSALGVFSQLAFVRMDTTVVGGVGYYANVLLLVAMLANAAGFLADRLGRRVPAVPALLLVAFLVARQLGGYNMLEEVRAEFLWSTVANIYPRPANFDLQLALYLLCLPLVPVMLLLGAAQGQAFVAGRHGWSGYLVMGFGGLAGAAAFTAQNQLLSDPVTLFLLWGFGLAAAIAGTLSGTRLFYALAPLLLLVPLAAEYAAPHLWSPYQRITLIDRGEEFHVLSNGFFISTVSKVPRSESDPAQRSWYEVALQSVDRGDRVLILGSGCATSDVREAVHRGAGRVDAVEIEREFVRLGLRFDPERTYEHPAVRAHVTDARRFLARTGERYDLVYFSFLDSQTLASGQVRFRLDSFLYTLDGLRLGWSRVSPGGTLLVNFFCGTAWLRQRMYDMIHAATGKDVQVLVSLDHRGGTLFAASDRGRPLSLPVSPGPYVDVTDEFRPSAATDLPTDDWPFFYSRGHEVPVEYVRFLVGVVFMLATVLLAADRLQAGRGTDSPPASRGLLLYAAFSGAAFFFIELRTIAAVTPVFGSTHLGQSLVIAGIIGVSLVGALLASGRSLPAGSLWTLLLLSLGLADRATGWFHPYSGSLARSAALLLIALLAPAGVAGYLYLTYLKRLRGGAILAMQRANLAGSAVGGLAECTTVLWGFRLSLAVALGFYLIALFCAEGRTLVASVSSGYASLRGRVE